MIRTTLFAAALAATFSASAFAQSGPRFVGEGNNPHVEYDAPSRNIVGSAHATVTGAPGQVQYDTQRVFRTQPAPTSYDFGVRQPWQIDVDSSN